VKLVIAPTEEPNLLPRLQAIAPELTIVQPETPAAILREIADADAFYGNITPELLAAAGQLRWIQSPLISLERIIFPELIAHPVVMTNPRGIFSDDIADHVFGFILCFARGLHRYFRHQQQHHWAKNGAYPDDVIHLPDTTVGIFGFGGIGQAVARRASGHEMRVLAMDPRHTDCPPEVEALWMPDRLDDLLGQSDFVVICTPETPETRGLFDARVLTRMRHGSYLINIGRGKVVCLDALVDALRSGHLAGAGLDVFEIEPLPADHPLWDMENVLITPHVAGAGPYIVERRNKVLIENVRRFVAGQPLINVVDKAQWF
jgi:phosphoglycerate dehydrogenase-like enzyme